MKKNLLLTIAALLLLAITGGYFMFKKFVRDRESAMNFDPAAYQRYQKRNIPARTETKRTYTKQELDEARKKGQLPKGMEQPYTPPAATAGQEAMERSLRTIQEINKMNEMNQRLMDEQRRSQQRR